MKVRFFSIVCCLFLMSSVCFTQNDLYTYQDSLRGSITEERAWWDLEHYELAVQVNIDNKSITGSNKISYEVLDSHTIMQIDLQAPLEITEVKFEDEMLEYKRDGNAYFIEFKEEQEVGSHNHILITYEGEPIESKRPPWSGGFTWSKDSNKNPFVATTCQGDGASMWWPCKDHMYDEPDSMLMHITIPNNLVDVSNGRLRFVAANEEDQTLTYSWAVVNPINNYGVNINIGNYVNFSEIYPGQNGPLDCSYWVLEENLDKAKEQFKQVPMMLDAFEHWFGPYPFYEDGYKLVEVPYLGMEHQSSVTYGNQYKNGYLGRDLSRTGWGDEFDFIIIHESGHEWFANSITYKDMADMWIHESFTAYSENLYLDYHFGKQASAEYVIGTRKNIQNDSPIIADYDVNKSGSGDMYYKGANMLHHIRTMINDDDKWRDILRGLNTEFFHKTVSTKQIEDYMIDSSGIELQPIFDQYLRTTEIPVLEYYTKNDKLFYRWTNCLETFNSSLILISGDSELSLYPTIKWNDIEVNPLDKKWKVKEDFFVEIERISK